MPLTFGCFGLPQVPEGRLLSGSAGNLHPEPRGPRGGTCAPPHLAPSGSSCAASGKLGGALGPQGRVGRGSAWGASPQGAPPVEGWRVQLTGRGGAAAAPACWVVGRACAVACPGGGGRALSNKPRPLPQLKWRSGPWPGAQLTVVQEREIGTSFSDRFASFKGLIIYTSKSTGAAYFGRGFGICVMVASELFL